jgi:chromosomal replication initiation ATPase DnaA
MTADADIYSDSTGQIKPTEAHPILTAADLARCEAISPRRKTPMAEIVRAVSEQTGIPTTAIYGRKRTADIAQARQIVMYLCRREGVKLEAIASYLGRDHTTVLAGINAEKKRRGEA